MRAFVGIAAGLFAGIAAQQVFGVPKAARVLIVALVAGGVIWGLQAWSDRKNKTIPEKNNGDDHSAS